MFFVFFSRELIEFGDRIVYAKQFSRDLYYEYPLAVDKLPPGSTVINLGTRSSNYMLAGSNHSNEVISFLQSLRTFGIKPSLAWNATLEEGTEGIRLEADTLHSIGATHVYWASNADLSVGECLKLIEIDRLDKNPFNLKPLNPIKILYKVEYLPGCA
jgi:hypothetical protein